MTPLTVALGLVLVLIVKTALDSAVARASRRLIPVRVPSRRNRH